MNPEFFERIAPTDEPASPVADVRDARGVPDVTVEGELAGSSGPPSDGPLPVVWEDDYGNIVVVVPDA